MHKSIDTAVVPLAVAWQLHCAACGEPVQPAEPGGWDSTHSFNTRLRFTLQRHEPAESSTPGDPGNAALITGRYSVSYNAARCTLALTGSLTIDGRTCFVDDMLTIDLASIDGEPVHREHSGAAPSLPVERLAGLAVMAHLGLRDPALRG